MNRRQWMMLSGAAAAARPELIKAQSPAGTEPVLPDKLLLKDYRPKSIFKIPVTEIKRAKFPVLDSHTHGRPGKPEALDEQIKLMDAVNVEKAVVFAGATGERFDQTLQFYSKYPQRFDTWCSFDLTGWDQPGFGPAALKELERCHRAGAKGVGEVVDKGRGVGGNLGTGPAGFPGAGGAPSNGPHPDDGRLDTLFARCASLAMPINLHVSDPIWGYEKMDYTNDGLMNGFTWRLDDKPGILGHEGLIQSLERALKKHPKTIFICCHFANLDYDLARLGRLLDTYPNLYADNSARYAETASIPRFTSQFYQKHSDRIVYGTDMGYTQEMFSNTFRILESSDEHFYASSSYHWHLAGLALPDAVLRKVYRENALRAFEHARKNA